MSSHILNTTLGIFLVFSFSSCQYFKKDDAKSSENQLTFYYQKQSKTVGDCENMSSCLKVELEKVVFESGYQEEQLSYLNEWVDSLFFNGEKALSLDALMDEYLKEYEELNKEIMEFNLPWSIQKSLVLVESLPRVLTFKSYDYNFRGGASEFEKLDFYHLNKETLERLYIENFILNEHLSSFQAYLSVSLKRKIELTDNQSLEELGFTVNTEGYLELPQNFSLHEDHMVFYISGFDVNPFYNENIELMVPITDLELWLNDEFFFHLKQPEVL